MEDHISHKKSQQAGKFFARREISHSDVERSAHFTYRDGFRIGFGFFVGFGLGVLLLVLVVYLLSVVLNIF